MILNAFTQSNAALRGMIDVQISPRTMTLRPKTLVPELGEQVQYLNVSQICKRGRKYIPVAIQVAELLHGRRFN